MTLEPITLREAWLYVSRFHRHHKKRPKGSGGLFALSAVVDGKIVAVAVIGRPKARMNQDGRTAELTRLCSDGTRNACSFLYGRAWRAARALGYVRMLTYTLASENGATLRAAGWRLIGEAGGGSWGRPSRPRVDEHPTQEKLRWEAIA
jgi:hypothetical protein